MSESTLSSPNLFDQDIESLKILLEAMGEAPYRAQQILHWVHQKGVIDFDAMLNLSKTLREKLKNQFETTLPKVAIEKKASDGVQKWLFQLSDGNCIETVYIPEVKRNTLCISSQIGCALNCSFCSTGKEGFNRNLSLAEIISQVWMVKHFYDLPVSNVVFMGMGEPLLNYSPVLKTVRILLDDMAYGLSKYRVTVSSSGVLPKLEALKNDSNCALAISLHAANNELRNQLVPINKKYPLEQLMELCRHYYPKDSKRQITMEYVMLAGVNDSIKHARELIHLLEGTPAKVNLIPFNPFPKTEYICSDAATIEAFQMRLIKAGLNTRVRKTRGQDIDGACGQLAGDFKDRTGRHQRWLQTGRLVPNTSSSHLSGN